MLEISALLEGLQGSVAVTWKEWESAQGLFREGVKLTRFLLCLCYLTSF